MKLNKLIGSFFIFAASLTIIGLFGTTAAFAQTQKNSCAIWYPIFLENRDGPEVHKLMLAVHAGYGYRGCDKQKDKEITDYIKKTEPIIKKEQEAGNAPTDVQLRMFCDDIFIGEPPQVQGFAPIEFSYNYEYRFWKLAGVDPAKDTEETAIPKVQKWLENYKRFLICDVNRGFAVSNGSLLKLSVYLNFPHLIDSLLLTYEVDINFVDLVDGKNVIDFIDDEIARLDPTGRNPNEAVKTLKSYRDKYTSLGARTSAEIKREISWTAEDYLKAANALIPYTNRNYNLADYYYSKAIELKPNNIEAYKLRATVRCKYFGKLKAAADEKKVIELGGKVEQKCQ